MAFQPKPKQRVIAREQVIKLRDKAQEKVLWAQKMGFALYEKENKRKLKTLKLLLGEET